MKFISEFFRIFFYLLFASKLSVLFYLGVGTIFFALLTEALNVSPFYVVIPAWIVIIIINPGRHIRKSLGRGN